MADILKDIYVVKFAKGLSHDVGSPRYEKLHEKFGKELMDAAVSLAVDPTRVEALRENHWRYQQVSKLIIQSIQFLLARKYNECAQHLRMALKADRKLSPMVRREEEIIVVLARIFLHVLASDMRHKATTSGFMDALQLAQGVVGYSTSILGGADPMSVHLRDHYLEPLNIDDPKSLMVKQSLVLFLKKSEDLRPTMTKEDLPALQKLEPDESFALMEKYSEMMHKIRLEFGPSIELLATLQLAGGKDPEPKDMELSSTTQSDQNQTQVPSHGTNYHRNVPTTPNCYPIAPMYAL